MLTGSLSRQVRQIETELADTRQAERIEKHRFKADLKEKLEQPSSLFFGLAGAAALGYLMVPSGQPSCDTQPVNGAAPAGGSGRSPWLEKLVDQGFMLVKAYLVASIADKVIEED